MAIIQISKLQQRSGNLVDLPQLDDAELGWASDAKRLFIGKSSPNENIEVLTSYSNISFSQINGSDGGNFNISNSENGQLLTYVSSTNTWENYPSTDITTANANFKLNLGNVAHLSISGGAIGYILETDGLGNLSWTPKGSLYTPIVGLSNATPIIMSVDANVPYTNGTEITISGANGVANANVNGLSFYVKLASNYPSTGNVELYTDTGLTVPADGTSLTYTNSPNAIATSAIGGGGGGSGAVGGSNTTVQFNDQNISNGVADFTFNKNTKLLTVNGNINTGNVNATSAVTAPVLVSNIASGTAPLTVTSNTRVSNLNVAYANVSDLVNITTATSGTFYPVFANALTGNVTEAANANLSFNAATGALSSRLFTGTITTATQPNITSLGILTSLSVTGNVTAGSLIGALANGNSNVSIPASNGNVNISSAGTANVVVVTATGANITGTLSASGNANVSNLGAGIVTATGNIVGANLMGPHANGTSNVNIPASNGNINLSAAGNANIVVVTGTGANITGTLSASGNANVSNLGTAGKVIASTLESNVATGTAPFTVVSTTRVDKLNVSYSNVADFAAMTAITTGTVYPTFISGTAAANYQLGSNTAYSANVANGSLSAALFVGGISTTDISTGANTTAGTITGNWTLTTGSRLQATYADLAEYYSADKDYEPGTVLEFGGEQEVTVASDGTTRVAGVVSTDPAYAMNAKCPGDYPVAIALQGRVPVKVRGTIRKGDMLVSGGNGFARPSGSPTMGSVIGKSLENFDGNEGVIEVAVGRL